MEISHKEIIEKNYMLVTELIRLKSVPVIKYLYEDQIVDIEKARKIMSQAAKTMKAVHLLDFVKYEGTEALNSLYAATLYAEAWRAADLFEPKNRPHEAIANEPQVPLPDKWPPEDYDKVMESKTMEVKPVEPNDTRMKDWYENSKKNNIYDMDKEVKGRALIINNQKFISKKMKDRAGSEYDRDGLNIVLTKLGFEVQIEENKTKDEMEDLLRKECQRDHSDYNCFILVMLSHGEKKIVFGTDGDKDDSGYYKNYVEIEDIKLQFSRVKSLERKPKLFIIQACQGKRRDEGVKVEKVEESDEDEPFIDELLKDFEAATQGLREEETTKDIPSGATKHDHPSGDTKEDPPPSDATEEDPPPSGATKEDPPPSGATKDDPPIGATKDDPPPSGATKDDPPPSGATKDNPPPSGATKDDLPPSGATKAHPTKEDLPSGDNNDENEDDGRILAAMELEEDYSDDSEDEDIVEADSPSHDSLQAWMESESLIAEAPLHIVVALPTTEGNLSYRNIKFGSWFIQAVIFVLANYSYKEHLLTLLEKVNVLVRKAKAKDTKKNELIQVNETATTLIKKFYFFPGLPPRGSASSPPKGSASSLHKGSTGLLPPLDSIGLLSGSAGMMPRRSAEAK